MNTPVLTLSCPRKLSKTADLTTKISLSLKKLSASAQNVEQAVKPIYSKTQSLTVLSGSEEKAESGSGLRQRLILYQILMMLYLQLIAYDNRRTLFRRRRA